MRKKLFYFGCIGAPGHYLHGSHYGGDPALAAKEMPGINSRLLGSLDDVFTPASTKQQGVYQVSAIPPVIIVAWHDYTGDGRPGSNSALIGYGYDDAEQIIEAAHGLFPTVMSRQPKLSPLKPATGQ